MKIKLSASDFEKFERIVLSLDQSMQEADYFNEMMAKGERAGQKNKPYRIEPLDPSRYEEDPFFRNVRPRPSSFKKIKLAYDAYEPHQGFVYDEIEVDSLTYRERTPFGYFVKEFPFLSLKEDETTWMSVTPHEINTMKDALAKAHGHVWTLGLGLGYFAYMAMRKEEVNQVTVVEKNKDIIDIFHKSILPFFPNGKKIEIIHGDAFEVVKNLENADYLFADLWRLPEDGLPLYARLLKSCLEKKTECSFWIEDSILSLVRRAIVILIDEEMYQSNDLNFMNEETFSDRLINELHFALKDRNVSSIEDVRALLGKESLKELCQKIVL